jgi:hypothetical protein
MCSSYKQRIAPAASTRCALATSSLFFRVPSARAASAAACRTAIRCGCAFFASGFTCRGFFFFAAFRFRTRVGGTPDIVESLAYLPIHVDPYIVLGSAVIGGSWSG